MVRVGKFDEVEANFFLLSKGRPGAPLRGPLGAGVVVQKFL